jgi:hypothetical protein
VFQFPIFAPPGALDPLDYEAGIRVCGIAMVGFGRKPDDILTQLGATSLRITQASKPADFARMVAKIAYSTALGEGVLDVDRLSPITSSILGATNDIGRWVGTLTDPIKRHPGLLHRVLIHEDHTKGFLIGEIQLFSDSETPSYGVILGKLGKR